MNMTGQDWNTALSVFFVTYAAGGVYVPTSLPRQHGGFTDIGRQACQHCSQAIRTKGTRPLI